MRLAVSTALIAGVLALAGCNQSDPSIETDTRGAGSPTTTGSEDRTPQLPKASRKTDRADDPELRGDWEKLGPEGFMELRLGMSQAEALATGRIALGNTVGRCTGFYLAMYGDASGPGPHGYFTKGRGLSVIRDQGQMHTPEGVMYGTRNVELLDSFAHVARSDSAVTARASNRSDYYFVIDRGSVSDFGLSLPGDPCLALALRQ